MASVLLIGGPGDGERLAILHGNRILFGGATYEIVERAPGDYVGKLETPEPEEPK